MDETVRDYGGCVSVRIKNDAAMRRFWCGWWLHYLQGLNQKCILEGNILYKVVTTR